MNKPFVVAILCLALFIPLTNALAEETSHLAFVREYVRELAELERLRATGESDLKQKGTDPLAEGIHYSTRVQFALNTDIGVLNDMRFDPPFETLIGDVITFHKQKLAVHDRLIEISTQFMSGPRPGVNYGELGAEVPKLRATLENIDGTFIKLSALVFSTLIDPKPDRQNHMSRLILSRAEKLELLEQLESGFGTKLQQKNQSALVGSAGVLWDYLHKGYTCSDEI